MDAQECGEIGMKIGWVLSTSKSTLQSSTPVIKKDIFSQLKQLADPIKESGCFSPTFITSYATIIADVKRGIPSRVIADIDTIINR